MSVFDPFWFVADFMIFIKLLMQEVWKSGIGWDIRLTDNLNIKFKNWLYNLNKLKSTKILLRMVWTPHRGGMNIQLHIFFF